MPKYLENKQHTSKYNPCVKKEVSKDVSKLLWTKNKSITYPNLWNAIKTVLRRKFITLNGYTKRSTSP